MEHQEFTASWNPHYQCVPQPKFKSKWVPLAGRKRKSPDEPDSHGSYDTEEPPTKQMAVDDEVAPLIIKDGYILDSDASNEGCCSVSTSHHPHDPTNKLVQLEDIDMDDDDDSFEEGSEFDHSGSMSKTTSVSGGGGGDGGGGTEDDDDDEHALKSIWRTKLRENVQRGSVILSEEVRASLGKKPSDVCPIIPRSIVDQMYKNAMAVVLWQPPATTAASSLMSELGKSSGETGMAAKATTTMLGAQRDQHEDNEDKLEELAEESNSMSASVEGVGEMEVENLTSFLL